MVNLEQTIIRTEAELSALESELEEALHDSDDSMARSLDIQCLQKFQHLEILKVLKSNSDCIKRIEEMVAREKSLNDYREALKNEQQMGDCFQNPQKYIRN